MDEPTAIFNHLSNLVCSLGNPSAETAEELAALTLSLSEVVSSYRGLELTVFSSGYPVVLTTFTPQPGAEPGEDSRDGDADHVTSLHVPLAPLGDRFEVGTKIVFYASHPGAFVGLAVDLAYLLATGLTATPPSGSPERDREKPGPGGRPSGTDESLPDSAPSHSGSRGPVVVVDDDRAPTASSAGISGLAELTDVNQAAGMLIADGHHPGEVHAALRRAAADAGLSPHAYALRLLAS